MNVFYYESEDDFEKIRRRLKQRECPHCRIIGNLILHGYLKGYAPGRYAEFCNRGHRVFCSDRGRRKGCGRTFSILLSIFMKRFTFCTKRIHSLLKNIMNGFGPTGNYQKTVSVSSVYRIKKLFKINQHHVREKLFQIGPPPFCDTHDPILKTLKHLALCFPDRNDPIRAFQLHFQKPFFTEPLPEYGLIR